MKKENESKIFRFENVKFFISNSPKHKGEIIAVVVIGNGDRIIKIPNEIRVKPRLGVPYKVECQAFSNAIGYKLLRYDIYVPEITILSSSDSSSVTVLKGGKITKFSFDLSGVMSPKQFYDTKRGLFTEEIQDKVAYIKWKAALQQISQDFQMDDWNEEIQIKSMMESFDSKKHDSFIDPDWEDVQVLPYLAQI